jgi:hypothetical protein
MRAASREPLDNREVLSLIGEASLSRVCARERHLSCLDVAASELFRTARIPSREKNGRFPGRLVGYYETLAANFPSYPSKTASGGRWNGWGSSRSALIAPSDRRSYLFVTIGTPCEGIR